MASSKALLMMSDCLVGRQIVFVIAKNTGELIVSVACPMQNKPLHGLMFSNTSTLSVTELIDQNYVTRSLGELLGELVGSVLVQMDYKGPEYGAVLTFQLNSHGENSAIRVVRILNFEDLLIEELEE